MGGLTDFLFEGKPPPSVATSSSTTTNIPQWMSDYYQGLIARSNQIAAEPYQAYGGPRIAGFTDDTRNAFNLTRQAADAYQGPLQQALGLVDEATGEGSGGVAAATPYMGQAAQRFPGAVQQYMDPYQQNVIDRAKLEARRFYDESLMPGLTGRFAGAGQYGSSAHMREANRAARDITEGLQSKADASLSQAYTNAGQMFGQDQGRQLGLAQLAGQLGTQRSAQQLDASRQLGALGEASQALGLKGAGALNLVGAQQQQLNQANLDTAYQDFQRQTQYPRETADWLAGIIKGVPAPQSSSTTGTAPASSVGPSGLQQVGSTAATLKGLYDLYKQFQGDQGSFDWGGYGSGAAVDDALTDAGFSGYDYPPPIDFGAEP
jgi:hypothetical protein